MAETLMTQMRAHWDQLSDQEREAENLYASSLLIALDVDPYFPGQTRFELTDNQVMALILKARQDGHTHDPIECGVCELTPADAPANYRHVEPSVEDWDGPLPATMLQRVDFDTAADTNAQQLLEEVRDRQGRCTGRVVAYADGRTGRCRRTSGHDGGCA